MVYGVGSILNSYIKNKATQFYIIEVEKHHTPFTPTP